MVRQSAGLILRDQKVVDSANLLAGMRDALKKQGTAFFVLVLPNPKNLVIDLLRGGGASARGTPAT